MKNYNFSVLMSVYKKENPLFFKEAMESILNQTLKPNEIVLIEDGPLTEELENIINFFKRNVEILKVIRLKQNKGLGEALRMGVLNCSYEIIARMDTDDISKKNRFEKEIEVLKNNPQIALVGSFMEEFHTENGNIVIDRIKKVPEDNLKIIQKMKLLNPINHPTVLFRKSCIINSGNYSQEFDKLEDYNLWFEMYKNNYIFHNIQESLLLFRVEKETLKRRANIKRIKIDYLFHKKLLKNNFINLIGFIRNIIFWSIYRIAPIRFIKFIKNLAYGYKNV